MFFTTHEFLRVLHIHVAGWLIMGIGLTDSREHVTSSCRFGL
ncbi:inorganic polyphosphate kinase [Pantoea ananatis]|nr:inorganic polyphosphate kinase [Pantoea ananatis]PZD60799.1 inorganic polyphosphate kinase [Pantoea ananatis]PZD61290.1 inorganic polyphosphate kinase [Pantoea ananatis]PZD68114.1 inorganic polyphosphate kinase [Pantoea ananatis]HCN00716.1 inorganic polyphosphate kinase [Pantoea ananatis]